MALNVFGGIGRPLSVPAFRDYSIGNLVSTIGRWAYRVAVGWLTWQLTGSEAWLGIVAFADMAPSLLVPLFGGIITDRIGSVFIIRLTMAIGGTLAAILAILTSLNAVPVELLVVLVALIGMVESFAGPARISIVHTMVPRDVSTSAIALNTASFNASRLIGPAIAGPIILASGVTAVFALNAISYFVFFALMLRLRSDRKPPAARMTNLIGEVVEAVAAIGSDPGIRFLMILMALSGFFVRPVMEFLPAFAVHFGGGAGTMSVLLSMLGFGAMIAGLLLARRGQLRGLTRIVIGAHLGTAVTCFVFVWLDVLWLGVLAFASYGFFLPVVNIGAQSLVQHVVGGHVRARVMSIYLMISFGIPALGALAAGWIASLVGLQITIASGTAIAALVWLWARRRATALENGLERLD